MPFEIHPHIITPPDDTVLWRYMAFDRLQQLLETEEQVERSDQGFIEDEH